MSEREHTITVEMLEGLDALYEDFDETGVPGMQHHRLDRWIGDDNWGYNEGSLLSHLIRAMGDPTR